MLKPILPDPDSLSLSQLVAQMIVVRTTGHLFDHEIEYPAWEATQAQMEHYITDLGVGGVILLGGSAAEVALRCQSLQALADIPLLLAADIEEGVGQRFSGATWFPPPMALAEIARTDLDQAKTAAHQFGQSTAGEALAVGLNWILAPVVDVNNNPANPVINVRAFGETPEIVTQLTQAFIQGAQAYPILTTAKHFPGHGDTSIDSHLSLPVIDHDLGRLDRVELGPFKGAISPEIAKSVDSVMTAHICLSALDQQHPATLSKPILTGLLRQELGFDGLIVTDALVMGAITETYGPYEAAVLAVEAGADVVLMPADVEGCIQAICEAVRVGRLDQAQIRASVERIWRAKHKVSGPLSAGPSCHNWEPAEPVTQVRQLAQPETLGLAQDILQASSRRGEANFRPTGPGQNVILIDNVLHCRYLPRTAPAITVPMEWGYELTLLDSRSSQVPKTGLPTLVQLFIRGNPFRSGQNLVQLARQYLDTLMADKELQAVVFYGSPYVLEQLSLPDTMPWVFSYGQMPMAQTIALESLVGEAVAVGTVDQSFTD
ncbi:beta-glucosidase-like glycosyl hydrolase [Leptolyngbya sp. Heron Island J]|uniref:glycoside hydrolase family 3 N-terminal domain-containing protein n=1 Tax=Leptolyngbya sp. Heron Island J TaxID=1385935 RepID=UPI0003B98629|nr:glycoside hydrolase family 3 N-terminal domain-containing protein [Leptolyngbya sp. Heron Island J]ESA32282.1 beta-glucosidase-like glycosyl hydrolase [Leptolyngbya sp. Heron Island J]